MSKIIRSSRIRNIRGRGDYYMGMSHVGSNDPPSFKVKNNEVCITHREYIDDINPSIPFKNITPDGLLTPGYPINPGVKQTFPWLSQIAKNFQQYKIIGMVFEYRSLCGEISTSLPLGSVTLATDYNSVDDSFSTRREMLNTEFHVDGKPSEDVMHPIECKSSQTANEILYVRDGDVPVGSDPRLYDRGLFQIAVNGQPSNSSASDVIGELYVSYKICFYKPIIRDDSLLPAAARYQLPGSSQVTASLPFGPCSGASTTFPQLDTLANHSSADDFNNGLVFTATTCTVPAGYPGNFMFQWLVVGNSTASLAVPSISVTNATQTHIFGNNGAATIGTVGTVTATQLFISTVYHVTDPTLPCIITLGTGGTFPAAISSGDVIVTSLPDSILSDPA